MPARRPPLSALPPLPETLPRGVRRHRSGYIVDVTVDGCRKTRTARTIPEAITARQELLSTLCRQKPQAARRGWTLKEAVERTWQTVWADKASQDTIRINTEQVLSFFGEACPILDITLSAIDGFVSHCAARGNSGATINRKLSCLSRILRTAHERGALPVLPRMPKRRESEHRIRFLSRKEEERMLLIIERLALPDVQDAILCLLYTGFRCGELWRLECRDIDLERGTITAWKTKNRHPRTIPLVEKLRPVLERRMEACGGSGRLFPQGSNEWLRRPGTCTVPHGHERRPAVRAAHAAPYLRHPPLAGRGFAAAHQGMDGPHKHHDDGPLCPLLARRPAHGGHPFRKLT